MQWSIFITSLILLVYLMSVGLNFTYSFVFFLFLLLNGAWIWMVVTILKKGTPSKYTFEEKWYDDRTA